MSIGVILHIDTPTFDDVAAVARAAEEAGADWLGLPDAFWWRDTWLLAAHAGAGTSRLAVGPVVTNPYLRHPFHTIAAVASLQDLLGPDRVLLGVGAGGSEITVAAGADRSDAGPRIRELVGRLRAVAGGAPLDEASGRTLDLPLHPTRVIVAGRGPGVLRAGAVVADDVLLWAIPPRDLPHAYATVRSSSGLGGPRLLWAPLVEHGDGRPATEQAAYAVLNSRPQLHAAWGLDDTLLDQVRRVAVAEGNAAASTLLPPEVLADVVVDGEQVDRAADTARAFGITGLAVRADSAATVGDRVRWARTVLGRAT